MKGIAMRDELLKGFLLGIGLLLSYVLLHKLGVV